MGTGRLRTMKISMAEQSDATTEATELATSAVAVHAEEGVAHNIDRELVEDSYITGSLTPTAPQAGMYADDIGTEVNTMLRGKGILTKPDFSLQLKSLCGGEETNTDGTCDVGSTTTVIAIKTGGDPSVGQLVYFPDAVEIGRVIAVSTGVSFTLDPMTALTTAPSEDDEYVCGISWPLASDGHVYFTSWSYFDGPKKLTFIGNKTVSATFTFEPGQIIPVQFINQALSYLPLNTSQVVSPTYDTSTEPLMCLGIVAKAKVRGTATGVPTQTETILSSPNYDVSVGDTITIDVGSSVFETVSISAVSGNAGSNITLTHGSVSVAAGAGDTVYVTLNKCSKDKADSVVLKIEAEGQSEDCISASYGRTAREQVKRTITLERSLYFQSWQDVLLRDGVVDFGYLICAGNQVGNIVAFYLSALVNTEVSLETDTLMKVSVTSQATGDATLGNEYELAIGAF